MTRQKNGIWKLTDSEMNLFSMLAQEASEQYAAVGCNALSKDASRRSTEIFNILDKAGYYDDVK